MDSNLGTTGRFEDRKISNRKSLCSCRKIFLSFPMIAAVGTRTPNPVAVKGQNARDVLPFQGDEPCIPGNPGRRFALPWALTLLPRSGRRTHAPRTKNQHLLILNRLVLRVRLTYSAFERSGAILPINARPKRLRTIALLCLEPLRTKN